MRKPKPALFSLLDRCTIKSLRLPGNFFHLILGNTRVVYVQLHLAHDAGMDGAIHARRYPDTVLNREGSLKIDFLEENTWVLNKPPLFIERQARRRIEPQFTFE